MRHKETATGVCCKQLAIILECGLDALNDMVSNKYERLRLQSGGMRWL